MAKVLVVDDTPDNVRLLSFELEDEGYEVVTAVDGVQALLVAEQERPDVILLDVMLPRMDGIEVCRRLKRQKRFKNVPVIMVSARDREEDVVTGLDAGASDYVSKPFDMPILLARVRAAARMREAFTTISSLNGRLDQALSKAEEVAQMKSSFLASMSHELRTPMNGILGMAELALASGLNEEQHELITTLRDSGEALLTILNDVLDFSKIEAGMLCVERISFDLHDLVEDVMQLLAIRASAKGIELILDWVPGTSEEAEGDPGRIRQVLTNLLGNAIKFTERGHVLLRVSESYRRGGVASLTLSVEDTGIGIAEERISELFQPFVQAEASTARRYGGTGLGLSISQQLAELMGGNLTATSRLGVGSTFALELALPVTPQLCTRAPVAGWPVILVAPPGLKREVLARLLRGGGVSPLVASSWPAALATLREIRATGELVKTVIWAPAESELDETLAQHVATALGRTPLIQVGASASRGESGEGGAKVLHWPVRRRQLWAALREKTSPSPAQDTELRIPAGAAGGKILLVEDNPVNQLVALKLLKGWEHQVDVASTGVEALELLEDQLYDLILMDCQMPVMDGYETTAELRRREGKARRTPVIAMTANAMNGDRERCLEAGMDDYVPKPIRVGHLRKTLTRWLAGRV